MLCAELPSAAIAARLAVIQAAGQLADDQHVGAGDDLRFQRAAVFQARPHPRRAQVRVELQLAPDLQQRGFGPCGWTARVERRIADGAEQNRVGVARGGERVVGQRRKVLAEAPPRR